jgi:hypothetical protein
MASTPDLEANTFGEADRRYNGSRFSDVVDGVVCQSLPARVGWGRRTAASATDDELRTVFGALVSFGPNQFFRASERTLDSGADLRWGSDGKGVRRLVHPNGVCLIGRWRITEPTDYSGYFSTGSAALAIARYSTCCAETRRGSTRSLSMVGKLYPTTDPNHVEPLRTANFMTQEDIGGSQTDFINDVELRNAPIPRSPDAAPDSPFC